MELENGHEAAASQSAQLGSSPAVGSQDPMEDALHQNVDGNAAGKIELTVENKPPKKKSKKAKKKKPTGFEEYYVDAPLTPAEHAEEKVLYDPSILVVNRLERAIQRYQAKRRFDSDRRHIFTKYLAFGGVDVGPKMFEGNDQRDLEAMDAEQILTATAASNIPEDRQNWTVDFEAVVKGFLSSVFPQIFAIDTEKLVQLGTLTIKNFLNYLVYHDVCPEYRDNIIAAKKITELAANEIWMAQQANIASPGDFNAACSTLFGGSFFDSYTEEHTWLSKSDSSPTMNLSIARKVVKFAIAGAGSLDQAIQFRDLASSNKLDAKLVHEDGFEITSIALPSTEVVDFYKQHAQDLRPVGKICAIAWRDPDLPAEDLAPGQVPASSIGMEFEFFVEESLLQYFFVGMKVNAHVYRLSCGVHYFDKFLNVFCSFYTTLPNEEMLGWKEPRDLRADHLVWGTSQDRHENDADVDA